MSSRRIPNYMESVDLPPEQRARDALAEADKKTSHLDAISEECTRPWRRVFHNTLWDIKSGPGQTRQLDAPSQS
jgi:hypothetical protein